MEVVELLFVMLGLVKTQVLQNLFQTWAKGPLNVIHWTVRTTVDHTRQKIVAGFLI